jgi:hypothetical protein
VTEMGDLKRFERQALRLDAEIDARQDAERSARAEGGFTGWTEDDVAAYAEEMAYLDEQG